MLRVSLLSAILAVSTAGSAPETVIKNFIADVSSSGTERGSGNDFQPSDDVAVDRYSIKPKAVASPSTIVRQASDGLYYVDAIVNGETVHFVVDTGSSVVVLNAKDAARTGVGASSTNVHVETAGGSSSMRRARIETISVAGQNLKGVAAVVMNQNLNVSLLGQSALAQLDSVSLKSGKLRLN
jgi:clan AA aspartic protease (TIGR02281 family)